MHVARLSRLASVLDNVHTEAFDTNTWFMLEFRNGEFCGTSGCACGWGALDPELNDQGLQILVEFYAPDSGYPAVPVKTVRVNSLAELLDLRSVGLRSECALVFDGFEGMEAAMRFFDLDFNTANWLFGTRDHVETPADVRLRINELLAGAVIID